jgi:predicted ArsR family transcriptional regulator
MKADSLSGLDPLAALAEPVRRRLYEYVAAQPGSVDRDQAAAGTGVGRPNAAFHLDRLAEAGLLDVEFRRRSGRTGPGAGRPAKFYRRPLDREISVSLPPRQYDLAAEILVTAIEQRPEARTNVLETARERGLLLAEQAAVASGERVVDLLRDQGYEPTAEIDGVVRLRNCPFHALVGDHRELTCAMNLALLQGVLSGAEQDDFSAVPQPRDGFCCVALTRDDHSPRPA